MTQQSEGQSENTDMYIAEAFLLFQTSLLPNNETQFDVTIESNEIETADAEHKNHETQFAVTTDPDPTNNETPNYICDYVPKMNRELYDMTMLCSKCKEHAWDDKIMCSCTRCKASFHLRYLPKMEAPFICWVSLLGNKLV
jgi:hypothetical protein